MRRFLVLTTVSLLTALTVTAVSFELLRTRWPAPRVGFSSGALPEPFRTVMNDAADQWTNQTGFTFEISGNNPACDDAGTLLNGADFFNRSCDGSLLGPATLAITESISLNGETVAAGITFNTLNWAIYDTPRRPGEPDFGRVVLHELGHVVGLDHEDGTESIMSSRIDDTTSLQPDDLEGVKARYPELNTFEPQIPDETPPPVASCSQDLKPVAGFCKSVFACLASNANNPGFGRVGCTAGVEANFITTTGCADSANLVTSRLFSIDEEIAAAINSSDKHHRKLHSKILTQGGKLCSKALTAEAKNVKKPDASKLNKKRSKARFAFIRKGNKAVAKGEKRGNPYHGPPVSEIANQIDTLVDSVTANP